MLTEAITIKGEAISLALLIWRRFQRKMPGFAERVLDLNPGLADAGDFLPLGAVVLFPIDEQASTPERIDVISLWD